MAIPFGFAVVARRRGRRRAFGSARGDRRCCWPSWLYLAVTRARGAWIGGGARASSRSSWSGGPRCRADGPGCCCRSAPWCWRPALLPGRWRARDANDTKRYEPGSRVVLDALDPGLVGGAHAPRAVAAHARRLSRAPAVGRRSRETSRSCFRCTPSPSAAADGVMSATMVPRRPHNELLERLAETGPLGLAAFVALFVAAFAVGAGGRARGPRARRRPATPAATSTPRRRPRAASRPAWAAG